MDELISRQAAIDIVTPHDDNRAMRDALEELPPAQPGQDREFIKLVRNSNGRPYYSIIYLEFDDNGVGHDFEGYSSYSLDVISDYLKKYFMPPAEPKIIRCKDCKHWIPYDWMFSEMWQSKNMADYPEDKIGCKYCDMSMKANDFCSRAERRTE